ncbi:SprT family protein [Bacillus sp. HMF5848]|uniref:SprT family protein n=1 Tax=Bacillus sp. HMF5848 TaxID=2495421 RepID=UPI000F77B857|nr:SprT family protein [Bacillus sp. HMF5848]RSK25670.1 SprT family protein [Bacillus sp. HMF5848]
MRQEELQLLVESISLQWFEKPFRHKVMFNSRLRTTGGRYLLHTHNIELNETYYKEHGIDELIGIIKHELCHYHLHLEGKGYKHRDADFRELLKIVDAPRFCKPLISKKRQQLSIKYMYACVNCKQAYMRKRKLDTNKYMCGRCKGKIKLVKSIDEL